MALFYLNGPVLMIFPERKNQLVKLVSLIQVSYCFYDTDSPLSVTNIAAMTMFYLIWPV